MVMRKIVFLYKEIGEFCRNHIIGMTIFAILTGIITNYAYDYLKQQSPYEPYGMPHITDTSEEKRKELRTTNVNYFAAGAMGRWFGERLEAEVDGQTYIVIDEKDNLCLTVADQRDYDGNGGADALVRHVIACGGNCCGDEFTFVSYLGNGHFQRTNSFGYSWGEPKIEKWKGMWSVVVTSNNEGMNTFAPEERIERYVLDSGKAVKVEESERKRIMSVVDLISDEFDYEKQDEVRSLSFDLDGDGIEDKINAKLWHRWGRLVWTIKFSNGAVYESHLACKRIGILATKSHSFNDLVCDQDQILRWSGTDYVSSKG